MHLSVGNLKKIDQSGERRYLQPIHVGDLIRLPKDQKQCLSHSISEDA